SKMTPDAVGLRRDTPTDTPANLNVGAILPQLRAVRELSWPARNDAGFKGPVELKWQRTAVSGQVVSPAAGRPVPDLPREDFLATSYFTPNNVPHIPRPMELDWPMGVRRAEVVETDAEGNYLFEGLPRLGEQQMLAVET